jgi:hypothetical protein
MNGLEMQRLGLAPLMRRDEDGVHREIRRTVRRVSWVDVERVLGARALCVRAMQAKLEEATR